MTCGQLSSNCGRREKKRSITLRNSYNRLQKVNAESKHRKQWKNLRKCCGRCFSSFPNLTIFSYLAHGRRFSGAEIPAWYGRKRTFRDCYVGPSQLGPGAGRRRWSDPAGDPGGRPPGLHSCSVRCKYSKRDSKCSARLRSRRFSANST